MRHIPAPCCIWAPFRGDGLRPGHAPSQPGVNRTGTDPLGLLGGAWLLLSQPLTAVPPPPPAWVQPKGSGGCLVSETLGGASQTGPAH